MLADNVERTERVDDPKARIGVVATDPLRVLGLQAIFADDARVELIHLSAPGAADDAALSLVLIDAECTPHLFELLDTFRTTRPKLRLIVMGTETDPEYVQRVIGAGAKGYLPLNTREADIRMAIEMVRDGSIWAPRKVLARLLESPAAKAEAARPNFTAREIEVLKLLHDGMSNREIAGALGIDESTVKAHLGRLMRKVDVSNRTALTLHPFTRLE